MHDAGTDFCDILIHHIDSILKEKEKKALIPDDWILQESMNYKGLLQGGTFYNAISRIIDDSIVQAFAEILSVVDRNCNLNLIDPRNGNKPLSQLWLNVFSKSQIMLKLLFFNYKMSYVTGLGARKASPTYNCKFPFSWLIYECIQTCQQWIPKVHGELCYVPYN